MSDTLHTELWSSLRKRGKNIETEMDVLTRKRTGSYYTDLELTDVMMEELVNQLKATDSTKEIYEYRFLEPCVGTGNFVFSYIKAIAATGLDKKTAQIMLNNIYVADVNKAALNVYKESLAEMAALFWGIKLQEEYFEQHIGTGMLVDVTSTELCYISINDIFSKEIVGSGFDIVATNPPYKNLKAERGHYSNDEEYDRDKGKYLSKIL